MKTLKEVQCQKMVVWSLVVVFSFLQIVPTGWAATRPLPVDELQGQSVSSTVDALGNSSAPVKPASASPQVIGFVDSTAFQLNDKPLSPATKSETPAPAAVANPIEKVVIGPTIEPVHIGPTLEPVHIGPSPVTNPIEKIVIGPTIEPVHIGPTLEPVHIGPSPVTNPIEKIVIGPSIVIPPAVQGYVDALKKGLGTGFNVTTALQKDGTYLVKVGVVNTCPAGAYCVAPMAGTFGSLSFSISRDGVVNRASAKADYNGALVGGKLLFDTMAALEASFHPQGSKWMPPPQAYIARLVQLASQITVKESNGNLLRFDHNGKSYKAVRDAAGNIKLELELPPAVQAYVKELQEKVGKGFEVTATLQKDGSYLISIADAKDYIKLPTSGLAKLSFRLVGLDKCSTGEKCSMTGFVIDPKSLQVHYYNKVAVDAGLLYEGMLKLQNYCAPGMNCPMVYRSDPRQAIVDMTRITVISADKEGIQFTLGNRSYRTYRDASGKVILEETLPPAVQGYVDALKKGLGTGFNVTTTLQKDGTYLVKVGVVNTCPAGAYCVAPMAGTFGSLQFNINRDGVVNRNSAKAHYNGMEVNGKLLFDAMGALEASFHSRGSKWMPPPQIYIARLVQLASQITVKEASASLLRFGYNGKSYKAVRDANGNIKLEEERPSIIRPVGKNPIKKVI